MNAGFITLSVLLISSSLTSVGIAMGTGRRGDHVYYSTPLISLIDPVKHGFHLILTDEAYQFLLVNPFQLPAIYVTAVSLDGRDSGHRQILFKEEIHNKMIKITGLREKSWYYLCVEYETVSIGTVQNQTTGTECRMCRTLDKFGEGAESAFKDMKLTVRGNNLLQFQLSLDLNFPMKLSAYLTEESQPLQSYIVDKPKTLSVQFSDLQSNTAYGQLCILEEPLVHSYTSMGRTVLVRNKSCFFDKGVQTTDAEKSVMPPSAQLTDKNFMIEVQSSSSPKQFWLISYLLVLTVALSSTVFLHV